MAGQVDCQLKRRGHGPWPGSVLLYAGTGDSCWCEISIPLSWTAAILWSTVSAATTAASPGNLCQVPLNPSVSHCNGRVQSRFLGAFSHPSSGDGGAHVPPRICKLLQAPTPKNRCCTRGTFQPRPRGDWSGRRHRLFSTAV